MLLAGELTQQAFNTWAEKLGTTVWAARRVFANKYSWFLYTKSWCKTIAKLVGKNSTVIEVVAGTGACAFTMSEYFLHPTSKWIATDLEPEAPWKDEGHRKSLTHVEKVDALEAASRPCDAIFAAWIPYGSDLDLQLADLGKPMIIVGESGWGCTGSEAFWEKYGEATVSLESVAGEGVDVVQWEGIHDHTWLLHWPH